MKFSVFARAALFCILGFLLAACGEENNENATAKQVIRPLKTVVVQPVSSTKHYTYPATVLPHEQVELTFRVAGRIIELPIRAALNVKKGDVIAQLDLRDFKSNIASLETQLEQAREKLKAMTAGARTEDIASLQAGVEAAQAQVNAAKEQLERTRKLLREGFETRAKLDGDLSTFNVAIAALKAKQQDLKKGQAGSRTEDVKAQEAAVQGVEVQLKTANNNLSDATLRAPFDGIIAKREVDNFTNIQAKQTIVLLQQLSILDLVFDVPGPDVAKFAKRKTTSTKVRLDALPNQLLASKLVEFATQADAATQTYRGRVSITPPDSVTILPGMTGNVIVTEAEKTTRRGFSLPVSAIASNPDGSAFVWAVRKPDNKLVKLKIKTGEASGSTIAILSGLKAGDIIAVAGLSRLQENMLVRPVSKVGD